MSALAAIVSAALFNEQSGSGHLSRDGDVARHRQSNLIQWAAQHVCHDEVVWVSWAQEDQEEERGLVGPS